MSEELHNRGKSARPSVLRRAMKAGALFVLLGLIIWLAIPHPANLMARATRVPNLTSDDYYIATPLGWTSNHEAVADLAWANRSPRFVRIDIDAGRITPLRTPRLVPVNSTNAADQPILSPNGQWVLFRRRRSAVASEWFACSMSGNTTLHWTGGEGTVVWSTNSRSWIEYVDRYPPIIRVNYLDGQASERYAVPASIGGSTYPLWYDGHGHVGILTYSSPGMPSHVHTLSLTQPLSARELPLALPPEAAISGAQLSPNADHIGWWIAIEHRQPEWMVRLLSFFGGHRRPSQTAGSMGSREPPYETEGAWISRIDGTDMHEVGRVRAEYAPVGLGGVRWCPDGKRLLLMYRNGLYTVPID
jgi:hypothetical protein